MIKNVDLSKRAIKFYEEQHLINVNRDENGYRNYSEKDIAILKEISVYRKLGIQIQDIKKLLYREDVSLLDEILNKKKQDLKVYQMQLIALKEFIETKKIDNLYQCTHYETISQAIQDAVPGFYGFYFLHHFLPYLQMKIETPQQQEAYQNILKYWDHTDIHVPYLMKGISWILYRFMPKKSIAEMVKKMDMTINMYLNPTAQDYEKLKNQVVTGVRMKNNPFYKYSIANLAQRKFMRELQNKGYNDIFIPNMIALSPKYKEYHEALYKLNDRICEEVGLSYDENFQLKIK